MAFIEDIRSSGGNMEEILKKKIETLLYSLQIETNRLCAENKLNPFIFGFLKRCSVFVLADKSKVFIIGTNLGADGIQKTLFYEVDQECNCLLNVFHLVKRDIGFEQPFGIELERQLVESLTDDNKNELASLIAVEYIRKVKDSTGISMSIVKYNPSFSGRGFITDSNLFLCLAPINKQYDTIFEKHICKAIIEIDKSFSCIKADNIFNDMQTIEGIWSKINQARVVIADVSERSPDVFYEIGIAHAVGKKVIFITRTLEDIPIDIRQSGCIVYENTQIGMSALEEQLKSTIHAVLSRPIIELS